VRLGCVTIKNAYASAMGADDPGIPGWFIGVVVLMVLIGVGTWLYRISVARDMAERAGLDPDQAARVAMFGKDGIDATYVASALAQRSAPAPPPPPAPPSQPAPPAPPAQPAKSAEERLRELQSLRDGGLISEDEFQSQRLKILGSI